MPWSVYQHGFARAMAYSLAGARKPLGQPTLLKACALGKHSRLGVWCELMSSEWSSTPSPFWSPEFKDRAVSFGLGPVSVLQNPSLGLTWQGCKLPQHAGSPLIQGTLLHPHRVYGLGKEIAHSLQGVWRYQLEQQSNCGDCTSG